GLGAGAGAVGGGARPRPPRPRAGAGDRLAGGRRDRLRHPLLRAGHALPRHRRPGPDPRRRRPDPRRRLLGGAGQVGLGGTALAAAVPLRRPDLLLLVPLALAGADLRRRPLGDALAAGRDRRDRSLVAAAGDHPRPRRGTLPPLQAPRRLPLTRSSPWRRLHG